MRDPREIRRAIAHLEEARREGDEMARECSRPSPREQHIRMRLEQFSALIMALEWTLGIDQPGAFSSLLADLDAVDAERARPS